MQSHRAQLAARNNATWCDSVCRAFGAPGSFEPDCWINRNRAPRYYPNLVALSADRDRVVQAVDSLLADELAGDWGVKDSFDQLDLMSRGFRCLFDARWLWREPVAASRAAGSAWHRAQTPEELAAWSRAHDPEGQTSFRRALLNDDRIAFLSLEDEGQIVAGLAANLAAGVVGISNIFAKPAAEPQLSAALDRVAQLYPGSAQVCWEPLTELSRAQALGFEVLAPLKVWVRAPGAQTRRT